MSGHDETIHPDYIPEDFRELLRMACDSVWCTAKTCCWRLSNPS